MKLLADLYQLLCHACDYYVFSMEDPFRSVGWQQHDLFRLVAVKTFGTGYTRENIASMLLASATGRLSRESLHVYQICELVAELKTSDVKYMAIEEAKKNAAEKKRKLAGFKEYSHQASGLREDINHLCKLVLSIALELAEPYTEMDYFLRNCEERDKEVILYRGLTWRMTAETTDRGCMYMNTDCQKRSIRNGRRNRGKKHGIKESGNA